MESPDGAKPPVEEEEEGDAPWEGDAEGGWSAADWARWHAQHDPWQEQDPWGGGDGTEPPNTPFATPWSGFVW